MDSPCSNRCNMKSLNDSLIINYCLIVSERPQRLLDMKDLASLNESYWNIQHNLQCMKILLGKLHEKLSVRKSC